MYNCDVVFKAFPRGWTRASTAPVQDIPTSVLVKEKLLRTLSETSSMSTGEPVLTWTWQWAGGAGMSRHSELHPSSTPAAQ